MDELNELRIAARNRLLCCVVGVAVLGVAAWGLTHSFLGFLAVLIVGGLPSLFAFCLSLDRYRSVYKKRFVRRTLQTYFSDLHYAPNRGIPQEVIEDLHMMNMGTGFSSEDYFQASYKGIRLEQSDVEIIKHGNRSTITLFRGRWIIVDFNKPLQTGIQIVQKGFFATVPPGFSRIEMESETFNRDFFVFAQDAHDAFYILTPTLMERIENLRRENTALMLCFVGNQLHIAICDGRDHFEPDNALHKLPTRPDTLAWMIGQDIEGITRLIDALRLDNDLFLQKV